MRRTEASACSSGEEDDEPRSNLVGRGRPRSAVPRASGSSPLANVGSVRLSGDESRRRLQQGGSIATFSTKLQTRDSYKVYDAAAAHSLAGRNKSAGEELVPAETIARLASKACRSGMATMGVRKKIPFQEVVEQGPWASEEQAAQYVLAL